MHRPWLKVTITEKTTVGREVKKVVNIYGRGCTYGCCITGIRRYTGKSVCCGTHLKNGMEE